MSRLEVDQWTDAPPALLAHLTTVAHAVGAAVRAVWAPPRVGLLVAGFEVPHLHLHVFAAASMAAFDFANAAADRRSRRAGQARRGAAGGAAGRRAPGVRTELIPGRVSPER